MNDFRKILGDICEGKIKNPKCPSCGKELYKGKNMNNFMCTNEDCEKFEHMFSPDGLKKESITEGMSKKQLAKQFEKRAEAERKGGGKVEINKTADSISVVLSDGSEYFFQGHEADELLAQAEKDFDGEISDEDYILAVAQNW